MYATSAFRGGLTRTQNTVLQEVAFRAVADVATFSIIAELRAVVITTTFVNVYGNSGGWRRMSVCGRERERERESRVHLNTCILTHIL